LQGPVVSEPTIVRAADEWKKSLALLQEGEQVRGTYEVERLLGEGAFAEVYRVKHRFLGRQAMKVFKMAGVTIDETEAMLSEAVLLSRIGHPNIVRVFEADVSETQQGSRAFFTMEYVAGGTLENLRKSQRSRLMPVDDVIEIVKQACCGLSVAHSENPPIIHRDIKPQNILVGHDAKGLRVLLSDFGLAKRVNPLTLLASSRGTLSFKAPEALLEGGDSCAGDIWALGTTLYLLACDRLPFPEGEDAAAASRFDRPVSRPSRFNIDVDQKLDAIVLRALESNPKNRYHDASEMLLDLSEWRSVHKFEGPEMLLDPLTTAERSLPVDGEAEVGAQRMVLDAERIAKDPSRLNEAADVLRGALNKCPALRDQYEYLLDLWGKGLTM
jgi:serine/threonine protein kinase